MLHHDRQIGAFVTLAIGSDRFACVFVSVAVEAVMDGDAVEILDSADLGKLVNEAGGEQNFCGPATRAIGAGEREPFVTRIDFGDPGPADCDRLMAAELFPCVLKKLRRRSAIRSQQPVYLVRGAVSLLLVVAEEDLPVAPSQELKAALKPAGPPPTTSTSTFIVQLYR